MALAGLILPLILLLILALAPLLRGSYDLIEDGISQFALGEHSWIGNAYFILSALLVAAFARGLVLSIAPSRLLKAATRMLYIISVCLALLVFVQTESQRDFWPVHRIVHDAISSVGAGLLPLSCILIAWSIKNNPGWRSLSAYSFAVAILLVIIEALSITFFLHIHIVGLQQRLLFLVAFSWMVVMSWKMFRLSSAKAQTTP
jgi:hypothetical protein